MIASPSHARLHFQTIMKPRIIFLLSQSVAIITCLQQSPKISKDITNEQAEIVSTSPNFDIFIFTQHWPYTTCYDWMSSGHGHKCTKNIGTFCLFPYFSFSLYLNMTTFQMKLGVFMDSGRPFSTR